MFIMQESNKIRNSNVPMQMHCRFAPQTCTPSRLAQRLFGKFAAAKSAPNPNQMCIRDRVDARKVANRIEDQREKAIAYHDTVAACFDEIRRHIDKLEEIVDDQMWPLPKYRELLFLR